MNVKYFLFVHSSFDALKGFQVFPLIVTGFLCNDSALFPLDTVGTY